MKLTYNQRAYGLFNFAIKQRNFLILTNRSKEPEHEVFRALNLLQSYSGIHKTDKGWALFFIRNEDHIRKLIPKNAKKQLKQLDDLVIESRLKLTQQLSLQLCVN